jgi:signal transduction histidine kinase
LAGEKELGFEVDMPVLPAPMLGDQLRVRQILVNLLSNGVKFTETGSVRMCGQWLQGELRVCVRDTGVGMTDLQLESVFEPFVQADLSTTRRFGGTGLGLSIARSLALKMGGELHVTSQVGVGSQFCLTLPAELEALAASVG